MLPISSYDMVRQINEERRAKSLRKFWWRHQRPEEDTIVSPWIRQAEVIEVVFGTHCDAEEPIGA